MSLVGPRPEESRIAALYDEWHRRRLVVEPGMTGACKSTAGVTHAGPTGETRTGVYRAREFFASIRFAIG